MGRQTNDERARSLRADAARHAKLRAAMIRLSSALEVATEEIARMRGTVERFRREAAEREMQPDQIAKTQLDHLAKRLHGLILNSDSVRCDDIFTVLSEVGR